MVHRLGAELPDLLAAISVNGGTIGGMNDETSPLEVIEPSGPIPVVIIHGIRG